MIVNTRFAVGILTISNVCENKKAVLSQGEPLAMPLKISTRIDVYSDIVRFSLQ